jgi:hypothetical protein
MGEQVVLLCLQVKIKGKVDPKAGWETDLKKLSGGFWHQIDDDDDDHDDHDDMLRMMPLPIFSVLCHQHLT